MTKNDQQMLPKALTHIRAALPTTMVKDSIFPGRTNMPRVNRETFAKQLRMPIHVIDLAFKELVKEGRLRADWQSLVRPSTDWTPKWWYVMVQKGSMSETSEYDSYLPHNDRNFARDRGMSLCRRAYDCRSEEEWTQLAPRLGISDSETIRQLWRTARAAHRAGMTPEQAFPRTGDLGVAEAIVNAYLSDGVVTNDRVLNTVLQQAGDIIGRRDMAPVDKFETLCAFLLKARREVLGAVE